MSLTHLRRDSKKMSSKKPIIQGGSADLGDTSPLFQKRCPPSTSLWSLPTENWSPTNASRFGELPRSQAKKRRGNPFRNAFGCVLKIVYPYTQWFCWSLSLLNGYFIGNIPLFFRQTIWIPKQMQHSRQCLILIWSPSSSRKKFIAMIHPNEFQFYSIHLSVQCVDISRVAVFHIRCQNWPHWVPQSAWHGKFVPSPSFPSGQVKTPLFSSVFRASSPAIVAGSP